MNNGSENDWYTCDSMNAKELFQHLVNQITLKVPEGERQAIIEWLLEDRLHLSRTDILTEKPIDSSPEYFQNDIRRLNAEEPLQYILGKASFFGREFQVNPSVLIPRPETELLISEVVKAVAKSKPLRVLDIGTGSGCIAITLAIELPLSTVVATDIDTDSISLASANAIGHQAQVEFLHHDILHDSLPTGSWDVVVSNPPYIMQSERKGLNANVRKFEPDRALFVDDEDPLIFHRTIARKSKTGLHTGGLLIMEINERLGPPCADLLKNLGFVNVRLVHDLDGRDRFVVGTIH